ncbi:heavy metal-associated isoprenylated plant protein 7-like [Salvia splendens]|uniref:heavy metal-associated isoprenylated plant protein 7-like n=1 Tax=Salvia splendens TaxID=180675 RepID=UPI001C2554CE|nr:heavy metal-associated isoprenylated plant protein 7-like [Salvia splendens]
MGEEKPADEKKEEAPQAAAAEKKEEAPKAAEDGKKEAEAPPPPQEIVLKVFMHCEGCARKVRRCLKGFEGVENVITDCRASKVVVKGERADPMKVFKRVQRKSHRHVELISPIPKPPTPPEEPQKPPEKVEAKAEEKKEEPSVITVVLGVYMHCDACAQEIRKRILRMKGIESAEPNLANSQVTVKGVMEPKALADYVYKKTGKHAAIVKVDPEKKEEKPKKEKKSDGEKSDAKKPEEDGKESKSGEAATAEEEDLKMELKKNEMFYNYYPQQFYQQHRYVHEQEQMNAQTQMFSDENPNACVVM